MECSQALRQRNVGKWKIKIIALDTEGFSLRVSAFGSVSTGVPSSFILNARLLARVDQKKLRCIYVYKNTLGLASIYTSLDSSYLWDQKNP